MSPGTRSATHVLTFGGTAAAANATGSIILDRGHLSDEAGNKLDPGTPSPLRLDDGQSPTVTGAEALSLTKIRVSFDEPVNATGTAGHGGWSISGGDSNSSTVSSRSDISAGSTALVLTLDGGLADDSPSGVVLSYAPDAAAISDAAGNALGSVSQQAVGDGIAPRVLSANVTGPLNLTVTYSEPVAAQPAAYASLELSPADTRAVTGPSSPDPSETHAVVLASSNNPLATNATGALIINETALADELGNILGENAARRQMLRDGQAPKIVGGAITGGRTLTITYSEPVAKAPGAYGTLTLVPGGDRGVTDPAGAPAATHAVAFDAPEAATNATGSILLDQAALADASGNALGGNTAFRQDLADAQGPEILRSAITGDNNLTIMYSEPVAAPPGAYTGLALAGSVTRAVSEEFTGNGTDTHVVEFSGAAAPLHARGTLQIAENAVRDLAPAPNTLGDGATRSVNIRDDRAPSVITAKVTGPGVATVTYSGAVTAQQSHYTSLVVAGVQRTVSGLAGGGSPGAGAHTISFTPADAPLNATGSVEIDAASILDDRGRPLGTASLSQSLGDGQAPAVSSTTAVSLAEIRVEFGEPVRTADLAGAGWSLSGANASGRTVVSSSDISGGSAVLNLALSGNLTSTRPDGVRLSYNASLGTVVDAAGNALASGSANVSDAIPPEIESAYIAGSNAVTVNYTETVSAGAQAYRALVLHPVDTAPSQACQATGRPLTPSRSAARMRRTRTAP